MIPKVLVVIPARYNSSRFPGKALADIMGKPMVIHVMEKALAVYEDVLVATDDQRILDCVVSAGGQAVLTSADLPSGTDRCAAAIYSYYPNCQGDTLIINLQGDEPMMESSALVSLTEAFNNPEVDIATLVRPILDPSDFLDHNKVKALVGPDRNAIEFSRITSSSERQYHHIGVYAFRWEILKQLVQLPETSKEKEQTLEQLRWMDHYKIYCCKTNFKGFGIDSPEDLQRLLNHLS